MKSQAYRMALLYDFYGDVLTDRQKEFYDLYYNEDLSLAEIAENYGITRQGVRDVIVRAEAILPASSSASTPCRSSSGRWRGPPRRSCGAAPAMTTRSWRPRPERSWSCAARWRRSDPWHLKD